MGGLLAGAVLALGDAHAADTVDASTRSAPPVLAFLALASPDERAAEEAAESIAKSWRDGYASMVVDLARLFRPPSSAPTAGPPASSGAAPRDVDGLGAVPDRRSAGDAGSPIRNRLIEFLEERTGQRFGHDLDAWRRWMWSLPYDPHPDYAAFKGGVLSNIDPRFRELLPPGVHSEIRLDQVDWGGVRVDGIPPLADPKTEPADAASWLRDRHVVFGVVVDGQPRAYPKRILAWHEMARDRLAGRTIALVYCTLCGAAIPYDAEVGGRRLTFGTSGLLYRSNKLMYDAETGTLWSALTGRPLVGPLAGSGLALDKLPVVTTTWGEWRREHPDTTVLSIATGHDRDYREGAAYREYFRTDRLLFAVPRSDGRLDHKDEVVLVDTIVDRQGAVLAIDVRSFRKERSRFVEHGGHRLALLASRDGAVRVYDVGDLTLHPGDRPNAWVDRHGGVWIAEDDRLRPAEPGSPSRARVPSHRAFWFGVVAQYPDVRLITRE